MACLGDALSAIPGQQDVITRRRQHPSVNFANLSRVFDHKDCLRHDLSELQSERRDVSKWHCYVERLKRRVQIDRDLTKRMRLKPRLGRMAVSTRPRGNAMRDRQTHHTAEG